MAAAADQGLIKAGSHHMAQLAPKPAAVIIATTTAIL
jgi:hypothetical protein